MTRRRKLAALAVVAVGLVGVEPGRAEVSAQTDSFGNYVRTVVLPSARRPVALSSSTMVLRSPRVWTVHRARPDFHPLNVEGDLLRDTWPTIAQEPGDGGWPWAVWSRQNGRSYHLVWSRWLGDRWSEVARVGSRPVAGDDLAPSLAFDDAGRPLLTWWRNEAGTGRVYLSRFLSADWTRPQLFSNPHMDSRHPRLVRLPDGAMEIVYETPDGPVATVVGAENPFTISDDLDPIGSLTAVPTPAKSGNSGSVGK